MANKKHGMTGAPNIAYGWACFSVVALRSTLVGKTMVAGASKCGFPAFEEFLAEAGPRPKPELTIDRIDNDKHYEKGNVRWATWSQQASNKRKGLLVAGRCLTRCPRGHAYTAENSLQQSHDKRRCKQCYQEYQRRKNRKKDAKRSAKDRMNTAVRRYVKRFGGTVLLHGLPPLLPHDCLPTGWPVNAETALVLAQKVSAEQGKHLN